MKRCLFTIEQNIIAKTPVPEKGIVSSNPERTLRLASHFLENAGIEIPFRGIGVTTGKVRHPAMVQQAITPE